VVAVTARETLKQLTVPVAAAVVVLAVLTALLQVPRWLLAALAEITDALVDAGHAAQDHLTGQQPVLITTTPIHRRRTASGS
jgi:hypothetical protein